ncbi:MAG: conjugal transfer protein MobC [Sediminibacterium sp.]
MTGENEKDLRKILDFTRYASILLLLLHIYFYCYQFFAALSWRSEITDALLRNLVRTGLFDTFIKSKLIALGLLLIALIGVQGKKEENAQLKSIVWLLGIGSVIYLGSGVLFALESHKDFTAISYMLATSAGYLFIMSGGSRLSRLIHSKLAKDIFNEENETFPQEERLLQNEYSVHFSACYQLGATHRNSYINIINPFRGTIVSGTPGAGKSWFVILPLIRQMIEKGYSMFIYDFKFDTLSKPAYNWMLKNSAAFKKKPSFYAIDFDRLLNRCNPLDPTTMHDITDAAESARTILLGLNREWIRKQGDFFVESPINFVTAVIWYLRKYGNGCFCTLPHVIEMMQTPYEELFSVLKTQPEVLVLMNPFISAYENDAMEQLEGQIASAKISMARLASPQLYWVLSGNDFTLDINDPENPKIVCAGNNPEKLGIYGAVLSLYISRLVKIVNKPGKIKSALVFDELPTIFFNHMDSLIATARSNKVAAVLGMQDFSQLRQDYGKDRADVLVNICGNVISGQVMGETSKLLAERFGKIVQKRESFSINRIDTSVSHSFQLDHAVPASKISGLSSGEFVGMVSDDPDNKIKLKIFHAEIVQDSNRINQEMSLFEEIPKVRDVTSQEISDNYYQISQDIRNLIEQELYKLNLNDDDLDNL